MKVPADQPKIPCLICGQQFSCISNTHVWSKHRITQQEYKKRFPGVPIKSEALKRIAYRNASATMSRLRKEGTIPTRTLSQEERRKASERLKLNNPMKNPATAKKGGQTQKGRPSDERTKEIRKLMRTSKLGPNNPRYKGGGEDRYPFWKKDRKTALDIHGRFCADCGMSDAEHIARYGKSINVHHTSHAKPLDNSPEKTIVLCNRCHVREERRLRNTSFPAVPS